MIADCITVSRILFSLLLLMLSPSSLLFSVLYLLCGVSDMLDGAVARKLHTAGDKGARLDSAADLIFAVVYAVRILPLMSVPLWIRAWTAIIAVTKLTGILLASKKSRRLTVRHSLANRLTGIMIFLFPLTVRVVDVKAGAVLVCSVATLAVIDEIRDANGQASSAQKG